MIRPIVWLSSYDDTNGELVTFALSPELCHETTPRRAQILEQLVREVTREYHQAVAEAFHRTTRDLTWRDPDAAD